METQYWWGKVKLKHNNLVHKEFLHIKEDIDLRSVRVEIIYITLAQMSNCLMKATDLPVKITQFAKKLT